MISIRILNLQIWPILVGNCQLNRSIDLSLKDSKLFSKIEIIHIQLWFDTPFEFTPDSFRLVSYTGYTYRNGVTELYSPGRNLAFDWYNTEKSTWHDVSEVDKIFWKDGHFLCLDVEVYCLLLQERKRRYLMSK